MRSGGPSRGSATDGHRMPRHPAPPAAWPAAAATRMPARGSAAAALWFCISDDPVGTCVMRGQIGCDGLPAGPGEQYTSSSDRSVDLDLLRLIDLGEHQHAGGRGVDAALRLGGGYCTRCTPSYFRCAHTPCDGSVDSPYRDLDVLVTAEIGSLRSAVRSSSRDGWRTVRTCAAGRRRTAPIPHRPPRLDLHDRHSASSGRGDQQTTQLLLRDGVIFRPGDLLGRLVLARVRAHQIIGCRDPRLYAATMRESSA